ncbi:hypothetical protein [Cupriavidus plantarum]|uniref:hypothetical protein n=1 Tax=Cupriavidus plantarum TaxID=942865 RepID=UPI00339D6236
MATKNHPDIDALIETILRADPLSIAKGNDGTPYVIISGGNDSFTLTKSDDGSYTLKRSPK